jgi:hypothetical protein
MSSPPWETMKRPRRSDCPLDKYNVGEVAGPPAISPSKIILAAAERQYPEDTKMIVEKIAELIQSGKLKEKISGGALLWLFRQFGMNVYIETVIRIQQDGKMVSVADKLKQKQ